MSDGRVKIYIYHDLTYGEQVAVNGDTKPIKDFLKSRGYFWDGRKWSKLIPRHPLSIEVDVIRDECRRHLIQLSDQTR